METIANSVLELIGRTPLVELQRLGRRTDAAARIVAKVESRNPAGSVKDRVALAMVEEAEARGELHPGATIIEPTSGNTGVGLALVCALKGYRLILTMPETMSIERRRLVAAYGARVELTPGAEGMAGAIARARALQAGIPGSVILQQFENPANPERHYRTTGDEIWRDTDGRVDLFVAGVGTGGTVSGTGRRLKELNSAVEIVGVEPAASPVLSGGQPGPHRIQGIGAGFVPANFDPTVVDRILRVDDAQAIAAARMLARCEGLLAGISSGAALWAALHLARQEALRGKTIVVLLPDTGERYLSTALYDFDNFKADLQL
ncbi:cysteine synthase A [Alistipes sp. An116]|uniref:cysteine synthase A n=1 Tax=Alistipes sp. An116 TaxID=1965546 RepID=UPI000B37ED35|nr:cysteine synthase A [Alistipes sp. An116]OUQ51940.1 cysteine synthase A [Alistipes sp. An116]